MVVEVRDVAGCELYSLKNLVRHADEFFVKLRMVRLCSEKLDYSLPDLFYKLRAFYGDDVVAHFKNLCVAVLFDVRYLLVA